VLFLVGENNGVDPPSHQREIADALREVGVNQGDRRAERG
jgi:hypothetical protein